MDIFLQAFVTKSLTIKGEIDLFQKCILEQLTLTCLLALINKWQAAVLYPPDCKTGTDKIRNETYRAPRRL